LKHGIHTCTHDYSVPGRCRLGAYIIGDHSSVLCEEWSDPEMNNAADGDDEDRAEVRGAGTPTIDLLERRSGPL